METKAMIEDYLETDVQLAKMVEKAKLVPQKAEIIQPVDMDDEMKTFRKAQRKMLQEHIFTQYYVFLGLSIFFTLIWLLVVFFEVSRMGFPAFMVATICWIAMGNIHVQISNLGKE
ncbi:MAG: hypothetical protein AAF490_31660 [Chloroflexota bacterium]